MNTFNMLYTGYYFVVYLDAIAVQRWKSLKCTEVCGLHCANSRGNKILAFHLSIKKEGENITGYVFSALKWPQLMSFDMQTVSHILNHVTCQMQKLTLSDKVWPQVKLLFRCWRAERLRRGGKFTRSEPCNAPGSIIFPFPNQKSLQHHVSSTSSGGVGSGVVQPGSGHHHHHRIATRSSSPSPSPPGCHPPRTCDHPQ